ncbi:hypothetical protein FHS43_002192 [Streptosporangium becharense]|uniref:Uncharacterized protein n=1 Tax=Streptosporangium becharense TaxID=1816182 RepID=A0A7W9MJ03_9ACTN|nr:hypothetical protein [Streptosporangium becharense]MBB2910927.1 hypothetical protein [Streptosporangium becharense]MBB5822014.1 hypothetical protein [Streptosporangium becharense]
MDSAIQVFGFLIGVSGGLFLLITLIVTLPGRVRESAARHTSEGAMWIGGPFRSEHGVSLRVLVLTERPAPPASAPAVDWISLAEVSEPGRHTGGASATW